MKIIKETTQFDTGAPCAVAIGKFDGLHKGHRKLIADLAQAKEQKGLQVAVFTFDPSPLKFFSDGDIRELTSREEKRRIFASLGVDILYEFPLNAETAATDPETFVRDYLVTYMHARMISAGEDLSFGYRGKGNFALLEALSATYGYKTHRIEKVMFEDREISSTYVREAVQAADMELAKELLERPYCVAGKVTRGQALGRTIGFPTLNLYPEEGKLLPPDGVYFCKVDTGEGEYDAVTNIGVRPTVSDEKKRSVEAHLYDFSDDLYDRDIAVSLLKFHRPEEKFPDVDALKAQLQKDFDAGKAYFALQRA